MVDSGKARYEQTAVELEPVAEAVVGMAAPTGGDRVLDLACETGNTALLGAARGADVVGVDASERRVAVARQPAGEAGLFAEFLVGDADTSPRARLADARRVLSCGPVLLNAGTGRREPRSTQWRVHP